MIEPKVIVWSKTRTDVLVGLSLVLYLLLSPIWVLVLILKLLRTFLEFIARKVVSPILIFLRDKLSSLRGALPKSVFSLVLAIPLITTEYLLIFINFIFQAIFISLVIIVEIITFPFYLLHILTMRNYSKKGVYNNQQIYTQKSPKSPNENLRMSLAYPKLLSKRFEGIFLFQIYSPKNRPIVSRSIKAEFKSEPITEHTATSNVQIGQNIKIKLFSPEISFSDPVTKAIRDDVTKITFLGVPKDNCQTGSHKVLVSLIDINTEHEIDSMTIKVKVSDFAFDHVSKPLLSQFSSALLGIGSIIMFALTLLEQIDKTIGLTSGTAVGVLATVIYANFFNLYQRVRPNSS